MVTDNDPNKSAGEFKQHYRIKPLKATARRLRKLQTKSEKLLWQALRKLQTKSEKLLWQALRKRKLDGLNPAIGGVRLRSGFVVSPRPELGPKVQPNGHALRFTLLFSLFGVLFSLCSLCSLW